MERFKGLLVVIMVILLILGIYWGFEIYTQNARQQRQQQQAVIDSYAESGYDVPVDLLVICKDRASQQSRGKDSFNPAAFVTCLDSAGFRIVLVGKDQS